MVGILSHGNRWSSEKNYRMKREGRRRDSSGKESWKDEYERTARKVKGNFYLKYQEVKGRKCVRIKNVRQERHQIT